MNSLFLRCETCKRFVDAGYRWSYRELVETGVVTEDDYSTGGTNLPEVSAEAVLAAHGYWKALAEGDDLAKQLGRVRQFLETHRLHRLSFGDSHRIVSPPGEWLDWLCDDPGSEILPRYFVEVLHLATWGEVEHHVAQLTRAPWWWPVRQHRVAARQHFERLVQGVTHQQTQS